MSIQPQDLDPAVRLAIKEWMAQLFAQPATMDPAMFRIRKAGAEAWRAGARRHALAFVAGAFSFFGSIAAIDSVQAGAGEGWAVLTLLSGMALGAGFVIRGFVKTHQELTNVINPDLLRGIAEHISLSRAERLYCDAVAALVDAEPVLTAEAQREILAQLNDLLASYRKLDGPVRQYLAAGGNTPIDELEQELVGLTQRRDAKSDARARATMDQSIALCSQRLSSARALGPAREQAEAQQELIVQAMASVQASLSRMVATGSAIADADVNDLQLTVSQVHLQTRAVEDAVSEVLALRV